MLHTQRACADLDNPRTDSALLNGSSVSDELLGLLPRSRKCCESPPVGLVESSRGEIQSMAQNTLRILWPRNTGSPGSDGTSKRRCIASPLESAIASIDSAAYGVQNWFFGCDDSVSPRCPYRSPLSPIRISDALVRDPDASYCRDFPPIGRIFSFLLCPKRSHMLYIARVGYLPSRRSGVIFYLVWSISTSLVGFSLCFDRYLQCSLASHFVCFFPSGITLSCDRWVLILCVISRHYPLM